MQNYRFFIGWGSIFPFINAQQTKNVTVKSKILLYQEQATAG